MLAAARTLLHLTAATAQDRLHHRTVAAGPDVAPWLHELRERGYVVVPHYYSAAECADLRAEIDRLVAAYPATTLHLPDDDRVHAAERVSAPIRRFHDDPRLRRLAEAYHQAPVLNLFTLTGRVRPVPGGLGSGGGWHRDSVHQPQVKAILYLSDVTEATGPYQYVPGTHRPADLLHLVRTGRVGFNQSRLTPAEVEALVAAEPARYRVETVTGPAGTLLLTDTRGLHRGAPSQQGLRYALTNYFFARHFLTSGSEARFRGLFVDRAEQ